MKRQTLIQITGTILALILAWVLWPVDKTPVEEAGSPITGFVDVEPDEAANSLPARAASQRLAAPRQQTGTDGRSHKAPTSRMVEATEVLATVNGKSVQLRDLMTVEEGETGRELTREQYDSRLQRAIEAELVLQAAAAQSVTLTEVQHQRLERITSGHQADLERFGKVGVTWSSFGPEQEKFEQRLLTAQMLEQSLVAKKAAVAPSPDPAVQARYEQARRELLAQLHAEANITYAVPGL